MRAWVGRCDVVGSTRRWIRVVDGTEIGVIDQEQMLHQTGRLPEPDIDGSNDHHLDSEAVAVREGVELVVGNDLVDREVGAATQVVGGGAVRP
jgi:hypothetical protein